MESDQESPYLLCSSTKDREIPGTVNNFSITNPYEIIRYEIDGGGRTPSRIKVTFFAFGCVSDPLAISYLDRLPRVVQPLANQDHLPIQ